MTTSDFRIQEFNTKKASRVEYSALNKHINRMRLERLPDDPPTPLDETIQNLQSIPDFAEINMWVIWEPDQSQIIAQGNLVTMQMEDNKNLAQFDISVLPEYRQQGLGHQLLALIAEATRTKNRRLLMTNTVDRVPGGAAFMQRIGAKKGLEAHTNQLRMDELDQDLINEWIKRGNSNLAEFDLSLWTGVYPEEKLAEIADLIDLTNQQPFDDLEIEDMHMSPDQIRQMEKNMLARGNQRWTFYIVDHETGKFAGYTEVVWNPNRPEILRQDMTGVFPQYRNKGLGRWLKATMLKKVLTDLPQVKYVRTGNADSNTAMLKINKELGFKPYMADTLWQVELQKVVEYLQS